MSGRKQQSTKPSQGQERTWIGRQVNHRDTIYNDSNIDQSHDELRLECTYMSIEAKVVLSGKVIHNNHADAPYYAGNVAHKGYSGISPGPAKPEPQQNSPLAAYMASLSAEKAREVEDQFMRYMFMNAAAPQQSTPQATLSPLQFALPAAPQRLAIAPGGDGSVKQLTGNELLAAVLYQNNIGKTASPGLAQRKA
ncbi:hypothetical protein HGRIS_005787 [Hohenbuehelia grisea]|uniref:Uncharacterized protein n=1 Tax=Hohenbuehelia grisea TaxID=104357 RepID=A0ABR3JZC9_9AGAR